MSRAIKNYIQHFFENEYFVVDTVEEFDFLKFKQILWPIQNIWTLFIANSTIWLLTLQVEFTLKKKNLFLQRPDSDYSEKYGFSKRQNMSLLSVSLVSSFCFEIDPQSSQPSLWQYWLSSFQGRDTKLYIFFGQKSTKELIVFFK